MKDDMIKMKKQFGKIMKDSREAAKLDHCIYCQKPLTSFCNSHSVPQFVLRNITENGYISYYNKLTQVPLIKMEQGINEAGTFRLLCNECDKELFKNYEDKTLITEYPTNRMLAEIAMKNILLQIYQRLLELQINNYIPEIGFLDDYKSLSQQVKDLDLRDYFWSLKRTRKIIDKNLKSGFKVMFWNKMDYVMPIAIQKAITLPSDLNGFVINDIYNHSPDIKMQDLHLCIFPLEKETVVVVFYHKDDRNYENFSKQFNRLSLDEKLKLLNYIIFKYTDAYFISNEVANEVNKNENLLKVSKETDIAIAFSQDGVNKHKDVVRGEVRRYKEIDIPNLLSEKFALEKKRTT